MNQNEALIEATVRFATESGLTISQEDVAVLKGAATDSDLILWLEKNFAHRQPLTREELLLTEHLKKNGRIVECTDSSANSRHIRVPLTEDQIQAAIADLEVSTRRYEQQSQVLAQQNAVVASHDQKSCPDGTNGRAALVMQRKRAVGQHLKFQNEDLYTEVRTSIRTQQEKVDRALKVLPSIISERLSADDRVLESLESNSQASMLLDRVRDRQRKAETLIKVLRDFQCRSTKDHLDRVYLESLQQSSKPQNGNHPQALGHIAEAKHDLETLYCEIDDVLKLVIDHEYAQPLHVVLKSIERHQDGESNKIVEEQLAKLSELTFALEKLEQRVILTHSHRVLLGEVSSLSDKSAMKQSKRLIPSTITSAAVGKEETSARLALLNHSGIESIPQTNLQLPHRVATSSMEAQKTSLQAIRDLHKDLEVVLKNRERALQSVTHAIGHDNNSQQATIQRLDQQIQQRKQYVEKLVESIMEFSLTHNSMT